MFVFNNFQKLDLDTCKSNCAVQGSNPFPIPLFQLCPRLMKVSIQFSPFFLN